MIRDALDVRQAKITDQMVYDSIVSGPPNAVLTVFDMNDIVVLGPLQPKERLDRFFYIFDITEANGFTPQTYYRVHIEGDATPVVNEDFLLYINNDFFFETILRRIAGLVGKNIRRHDFIYVRGNVVEYKISIYNTKAELDLAVLGTLDRPLARYKVTARYDKKFNRFETTSIKEV